MKEKKLKLSLNKNVVSNLQAKNVSGGLVDPCSKVRSNPSRCVCPTIHTPCD